jgi:hypothetical protein
MTKAAGFLARFWGAKSGSVAEAVLWIAVLVAVGVFALFPPP